MSECEQASERASFTLLFFVIAVEMFGEDVGRCADSQTEAGGFGPAVCCVFIPVWLVAVLLRNSQLAASKR